MKCIVFFILLFAPYTCLCSSSDLNDKTYTEAYDLRFKMPKDSVITSEHFYSWRINAAYSYHSFLFPSFKDSIYTLSYDTTLSTTEQLEFEFEQRILLPIHDAKVGRVIFEGLGENLGNSYLVIEGLDYKEKKIFSDSLQLQLIPELTKHSKDIILKDVELLNLNFYIKGKKKTKASAGFSKLDILLNDKHIDTFPLRKLVQKVNFAGYKPIDLSEDNTFEKIAIIKNKKIIGLGESVHRNYCINDMAYKFIESQVQKGVCKLILLEWEMEQTLLYNRYIRGWNVELEGLDNPEFQLFLQNIREYNQGKDCREKVTLLGIDYNFFQDANNNSFNDIFYYIISLNDSLRRNELDHFALAVLEEDKRKTFSFIQKHKEVIQSIISVEDYRIIEHILNLSHTIGNNKTKRFSMRDSVMYVNTKFSVQNFCPENSSTMIYAHGGHLNYISSYPAVPCTPLGSYLKEEFTNQYSALLLSIGQGDVRVKDFFSGLINKKLSFPVEGSLEYQLGLINENVIYFPLTSEVDKLLSARFIGGYDCVGEFFPFNLYQRYDGILYINECMDTTNFLNREHDLMNKLFNNEPGKIDSSEWNKLSQELEMIMEEKMNKLEVITKKKDRYIEEIKKRIENDGVWDEWNFP